MALVKKLTAEGVKTEPDRLATPSRRWRQIVRERFRALSYSPPTPQGFGPQHLPPTGAKERARRRRQLDRGIVKPSEE